MRVLGLTGNIACGKSSVARMLRARGVAFLDSDDLVHELYSQPEFAACVAALFEVEIVDSSGAIDRARLGKVVFGNAAALAKLEELVHPAVAQLRARKLTELEDQKAVVIEAVKLLESGQGSGCDEIWCVVCSPEIQLRRLMENRGLSEEAARERLRHQPTLENKAKLAGKIPLILLENNGSWADLESLVEREWKRFLNDRNP